MLCNNGYKTNSVLIKNQNMQAHEEEDEEDDEENESGN